MPVFQAHYHTADQDFRLTTTSALAGYHGAANTATTLPTYTAGPMATSKAPTTPAPPARTNAMATSTLPLPPQPPRCVAWMTPQPTHCTFLP